MSYSFISLICGMFSSINNFEPRQELDIETGHGPNKLSMFINPHITIQNNEYIHQFLPETSLILAYVKIMIIVSRSCLSFQLVKTLWHKYPTRCNQLH